MSRTELTTASQHLESAADAATDADAQSRLADIADQLADLAEGEHGPDHGRLARIQTALGDVEEDASTEVSGQIDDALTAIVAYRETIEGV
jgi:hypothetical protein